ncbi:dihydrolipoamide dehydrogenase [Litorimonas taeanensis]|uniref:Dihydrolipoyl dehydrogenase n=1 Tax=Litorimonas taeanensis TaxID=568099 RepID=A0A420WJG0_9PROT|nr:dihydrolipoyl dehydrogenase [Litorimonas taeanensis]RKQ71066.1 dihydrolipoamide dehydrogenase [Litorimonas taeanensis]
MADTAFDVIVIGSGPGGYVTAIRSAQLGFKTAIVEKDDLGGVCLNWGCIPTKALLRSAEVYHNMQHASNYGLSAEPSFDLAKIVERSRKIAGQLSGGIKHLMKKNKVNVISGFATLKNGKEAPTVVVDGTDYSAKHVILASGARARTIPQAGLEPDGKYIWTAREAMVPDTIPNKLLVVGSGAIGMEFASFFDAFGADVTVVEMVDRILPAEDEEISKMARKAFEKRGVTIKTETQASVKTGSNGVTATLTKDGKSETAEFDRVILAVGIVGNVEDMGLEDLGVKIDRTHITVDEYSFTGVKGLYAIGDVTTPPWLAHKASHEGIICIEKIAGQSPHPLNANAIPGCTYCHPQIASVGYTEAQAKEAGYDVKVGRFPFIGNGKAIALGEPEGLIKTVFDAKTGELLGAHMIGAEVTELIQGYTIAQKLETTEHELMETVFPHPTLSEMMHEAVLDAYGRTIHF